MTALITLIKGTPMSAVETSQCAPKYTVATVPAIHIAESVAPRYWPRFASFVEAVRPRDS